MKKSDLIIADEILRAQIMLMRFTAGEQKRVVALLLGMRKELKAKLQTGLTDFSRARVNKTLKACTAVINSYYAGIQTELNLFEVAQIQRQSTANALTLIGLDASLPTAAVLKALVSNALIDGAPLSAWWAKQAEDTAFRFAAQVRQGVAQGETLNQIVDRIVGNPKKGIAGTMDIARRHASTLTHDAIMQISNDARMATYQENENLLRGYRQLSTLDSRTSAICVAYSGATWNLNYKPMEGTTLPFNNGCPRHPGCRSVIVPLTKTYRQLGIDVPEKEPGTRASDLGQIKADTTFEAFLDRHDKAYSDRLLGKGKAELYRSGKITLRDLVDGNGRELTLEQLKAGL